MFGFKKTLSMPKAGEALPGRNSRSAPRPSISSITTR